jgi:hypothetical protein
VGHWDQLLQEQQKRPMTEIYVNVHLLDWVGGLLRWRDGSHGRHYA